MLDVNGNIALASNPYALAQDAASAIKLFAGELWYDTTQGIPYLSKVLGRLPSLAYLKGQFEEAALTVPEVASAKVFISSVSDRGVSGQVQVTSTSGQTSAASFSVVPPPA